MLPRRSIRALYALALAEGEGVGTAYEYFAKRLVLGPWLASLPPLDGPILLAGLPQKYGTSLDFLLLAQELEQPVLVVDERPEALARGQQALGQARQAGALGEVAARFVPLQGLADLARLEEPFSLCLCSEVLQRLPAAGRAAYLATLRQLAPNLALFCPNEDNRSHAGISGLAGLALPALRQETATAGWQATCGLIDMPPFPPGISRSPAQRQQASSGLAEGLAMAGLGLYARLERWMPASLRRRHSHIVYAFHPGHPARRSSA